MVEKNVVLTKSPVRKHPRRIENRAEQAYNMIFDFIAEFGEFMYHMRHDRPEIVVRDMDWWKKNGHDLAAAFYMESENKIYFNRRTGALLDMKTLIHEMIHNQIKPHHLNVMNANRMIQEGYTELLAQYLSQNLPPSVSRSEKRWLSYRAELKFIELVGAAAGRNAALSPIKIRDRPAAPDLDSYAERLEKAGFRRTARIMRGATFKKIKGEYNVAMAFDRLSNVLKKEIKRKNANQIKPILVNQYARKDEKGRFRFFIRTDVMGYGEMNLSADDKKRFERADEVTYEQRVYNK